MDDFAKRHLALCTSTDDERCLSLEADQRAQRIAGFALGTSFEKLTQRDKGYNNNRYVVIGVLNIDIWPQRLLECLDNKAIQEGNGRANADKRIHICFAVT